MVILLVLLGYFVYLAVDQQIYIHEVQQEKAAVQKQYEKEQAKNKELTEEKNELENPQYIEKIARDEFGMTKKGEVPYVASDK